MIITAKPSVPPIARPAQSRAARGLTATAITAQTSKNVPEALGHEALRSVAEQAEVQRGRADVLLVGEVVDQQELRHQRAGHRSGQLQQDVDGCVVGPDLAQRERASVTAGFTCAPETLPIVGTIMNSTRKCTRPTTTQSEPVPCGLTNRHTASVMANTRTNVPRNSATYAAGDRCSTIAA